MKWTEPKPPTKEVSHYDHITSETPLGQCIIEWKSWKDYPSYDIMLGDTWIGTEYTLDDAKSKTKEYLQELTNRLIEFLNFEY